MVASASRERAITGPRLRMEKALGREPGVIVLLIAIMVGAVLRVLAARQSLFGDEIATYWDIHSHSLGGLVAALHGTHIEITPPLFFALSWLTSHLGHAPAYLRLPSLLAGMAIIPAVFWLGAQTVGRRPGLLAAALTALSPFMTYYASEARAYAVLMLLVTLSTLSMLRAIETGRRSWWVAYAVCSCATIYTHYTGVFYLATQFLWLLWAHPRLWRPALLANLAAGIGILPWASAIVSANNSPTTAIMSALSPFSAHDVRVYLEHWALGAPYPAAGPLTALPGRLALSCLVLAMLIIALGIALRQRQHVKTSPFQGATGKRRVLVVLLLLSTPVGEALQSATGTHVFGVRNLAASWCSLALCVAALALSPGRRARIVASALILIAFVIAAIESLQPRWHRPNYQAAAAFVGRWAPPDGVVIDGTGGFSGQEFLISPGPLTGLDVSLAGSYRILRSGAPQERDHPFAFADRAVRLPEAISEAVTAAHGAPIVLVGMLARGEPLGGLTTGSRGFPAGYHVVRVQRNPGIVDTAAELYSRAP